MVKAFFVESFKRYGIPTAGVPGTPAIAMAVSK